MYPILAVANLIVEYHHKHTIPQFCEVKLQKLLFLAEAWSYKIYKSPLIDDFFALSSTGPVNSWIHNKLKYYQGNTVQQFISSANLVKGEHVIHYMIVPKNDQETRALVDKVISVYGDLRPTQLIYFTLKVAESLKLKEGSVLNREHFAGLNLKPVIN